MFYCWGFSSLRGKQSRVPFGSASSRECCVGCCRQETGRVQQFCWVTQQGQELPSPHRAVIVPRDKHLPVQKGPITSRSADSKTEWNNSLQKPPGLGAGQIVTQLPDWLELRLSQALPPFPQGKATHKVHRGFPQVRDCRIWPCGQQQA